MLPKRYPSFEEAQANLQEGKVVAGCYLDDKMREATYLNIPADMDKVEATKLFFHIRNGKPMDTYQTAMLDKAAGRA